VNIRDFKKNISNEKLEFEKSVKVELVFVRTMFSNNIVLENCAFC